MQASDTPIQIGRHWLMDDGTILPVIAGAQSDEGEPTEAPADEAPAEGETDEAPAETPIPDAPGTESIAYALPADADTLDDDALRAEHARLGAEFAERRPTAATLADAEYLRSLREGQAAIAAILQARVDAAVALDSALADLGDDPALPEPVAAPAAPAVEAPAARAAAVAAAATGAAPVATQERPAEAPVPVSRVAAVAAASGAWRGVRDDVISDGVSFAEMVNTTRPAADVETRRASVMAVTRRVEDEASLLTDSQSHNDAVLEAAIEAHRRARREAAASVPGVRSAAICDPATIIRDAFVCGTDATPLQNALVGVQANSGNRLKFQYRAPTSISAASAGVREWSTTNQAAVSPTDAATWKPCVAIACPTYNTESATEITACYSIDAFTELSSPEAEADFVGALDRVWARYTEGWFLRKLDTFLHPWSFNGQGGAVPDVIEAILTTATYGEFVERLGTLEDYVVLGSPGLLAALVVDENRRAFGDSNKAMSDVLGLVRQATGTDYVQLLDQPLSSADPGVIGANPFPTLPTAGGAATALSFTGTPNRLNSVTFTLRLIDPSAFAMWTTGEAIFGEQITLDQARQNQRGLFK
ncbi:MAG TPA: hypothetical protein VF119_11555, partial [Candidatus Limnocylindrales bacterium]